MTLTACNGVAPKATPDFTLTVDQKPVITCVAMTTTVVVGQAGFFTVTTSGFPAAALSAFSLPAGLSFTDNGNRTATLSGTPLARSTVSPTIKLTASNSPEVSATQTLTRLVDQAPIVTSANGATLRRPTPPAFR